jgi:hypothetical protein
MRPLSQSLTVLGAAALAATLVAGPASAKPAITLTAGGLSRGADISVPHLEGKTVVDGAVRVPVAGPEVRLLGKSGTTYVVGTTSKRGGHGRIYRVTATGTKTLLAKAHPYMSILSGDGATLVTSRVGGTAESTITAYDVATGAQKAKGIFRDYAVALDAQGDQVILGSSEVRRVTSGALLWRSCIEQVAAFNADASQIATVGILSDGPGPGRVDARTIAGKHLGRYQVGSGWFGEIRFESPTALLLDVNGARKAFTARCDGTACERASDVHPAETLRAS